MSLQPWNDRPSRDFVLWGLSFLCHLCLMVTIGVIGNPKSPAPAQTEDRVIGVALRHSLPHREEQPAETEPLDHAQSSQHSSPQSASTQLQAAHSPRHFLTWDLQVNWQ